MALSPEEDIMVLRGHCTVEEAEDLLQWLVAHPAGRLDLDEVTHLHAAVLQAIAGTDNAITKAPRDPFTQDLVAQLKQPDSRSAR